MATLYTGKDVLITFNGITKRFLGIEINLTSEKFDANPSDTQVTRRGTATQDCTITLRGQDSDDADAATFADVGELKLSQAAPSALSWTDTGATPVSKLPSSFFDYFPLPGWRVDDVTGGSGGPGDVNEWSATITPNNDDTPPAAP
jgi:hypothetical protein